MKILVACRLPNDAIGALRALGSTVEVLPELTPEALPGALRDAGVLIVDRLRVSPSVIRDAGALQMIVRVGADVGNIAVEEASRLGIFVCHCPQCAATAVAELALGLLVALDRGVVEHACAVRSGTRPPVPDPTAARGLAGATLGLLGWDAASEALALRAVACGMRVRLWTDAFGAFEEHREPQLELCAVRQDLARGCDAIFSYAPETHSGPRRPDAEFLRNLRRRAMLVYVGDPEGLDQAELVQLVRGRQLRLAIDAYTGDVRRESARVRPALAALPGVIVTRQLAGATAQAREAAAREAVEIVRRFLVSGEVRNCINLLERSPATWQLLLRLRDTVGVMAAVMDAIRADGINAEEISTRVFVGARAAWCTIALDERPSAQALETIRHTDGVLHLELRAVV